VSATAKASPGSGGGGGGGGLVDKQAYNKSPNAVSRNGGTGGNSYVPPESCFVYIPDGGGLGGAGVQLIAATPQAGSSDTTTIIIKGKPYGIPRFFTDHAIAPPDATTRTDAFFVSWPNVVSSKTKPQVQNGPAVTAGQPIPQGDYILDIWTDGYGFVSVGDTTTPWDGTKKVTTYNITLAAEWNNRITLSYKWFKNTANVCKTVGIAVTLRRRVDEIASDANYLWTTRSPGSYIKPTLGSGTAGQPAKVRISWGPSVPTNTAVIPTGKATYPTTPAVPSIPPAAYNLGSYISDRATDGYTSYWVYPKADWSTQPWIPALYWEDLNILVTTGMVLRAVIVDHQAGSIVLTDNNGVSWTHIPTSGNWNSAIPIPTTLNIIVKIVFNAGYYGYGGADIKNSAGAVVWNTRNPWKHSV
jgi:hypothetical protein